MVNDEYRVLVEIADCIQSALNNRTTDVEPTGVITTLPETQLIVSFNGKEFKITATEM